MNKKGRGTSKYLGVCWHINKWVTHITVNGKCLHLGLFASEEEAAKAYDNAALLHHKEFANLNFKQG
jgi:hypothetical protein